MGSTSEIDDDNDNPTLSLKKIVYTSLIIKYLQKPLRHVLNYWRLEKELSILDMKYKIEQKELNFKKNQVTLLYRVRMINARYLHRM